MPNYLHVEWWELGLFNHCMSVRFGDPFPIENWLVFSQTTTATIPNINQNSANWCCSGRNRALYLNPTSDAYGTMKNLTLWIIDRFKKYHNGMNHLIQMTMCFSIYHLEYFYCVACFAKIRFLNERVQDPEPKRAITAVRLLFLLSRPKLDRTILEKN
jgi:hypothetical protein